MTNVELLDEKVREAGLKKNYIADRLGISYQGLLNKLSGKTDFKLKEVNMVCEMLNITSLEEKERIFFDN